MSATRTVTLPILGESVDEGTITHWLKQPGDTVAEGEPFYEVSTDKVDSEVPAPFGGVVVQIVAAEGDVVPVGGPVAVLAVDDQGATDAVAAAEPASAVPPPKPAPVTASATKPTPVDTNPTTEIVIPERQPSRHRRLAAIPPRPATQVPVASIAPAPVPAVRVPVPTDDVAAPDGSTFVPHTPMRRAIAARMRESIDTAAHTLVVMEADYEAVAAARTAAKQRLGARAANLTYLPFVARAVIEAVRRFPDVNSHVAPDGLRVFDAVHLGIAVDLDQRGLLVPVVHDADSMRMLALGDRIADVAERTRAGKLRPGETDRGTLTITNAGGRGSLFGRPVINLPQAVIVETDLVEERVVGARVDGSPVFTIRRRGYLSMSYDHRAFDGAYACGFLAEVCRLITERDWAAEL